MFNVTRDIGANGLIGFNPYELMNWNTCLSSLRCENMVKPHCQCFSRRQFDLASREASDESAAWRKRYDEEAEKSTGCQEELNKTKQLLKEDSAVGIKKKLDLLQKENIDLLERLESLKQELESEKLKCSMRQI